MGATAADLLMTLVDSFLQQLRCADPGGLHRCHGLLRHRRDDRGERRGRDAAPASRSKQFRNSTTASCLVRLPSGIQCHVRRQHHTFAELHRQAFWSAQQSPRPVELRALRQGLNRGQDSECWWATA